MEDHECSRKSTRPMNDAAKAAIARQERQNQNQGITKYFQRQTTGNAPQPPRRPNTAQIQGNLSEDEALARALQASLGDAGSSGNESSLTQEEQDRMLALSLAQGEQTTTGRTGTSSNSDKSCQIS